MKVNQIVVQVVLIVGDRQIIYRKEKKKKKKKCLVTPKQASRLKKLKPLALTSLWIFAIK